MLRVEDSEGEISEVKECSGKGLEGPDVQGPEVREVFRKGESPIQSTFMKKSCNAGTEKISFEFSNENPL